MEISWWVILIVVLIIITAIILFYVFYDPVETNICEEEDLMTETEAWTYYETGQIAENPFYLVAPDHDGPFGLTLKSIPKKDTTCYGCGSKDIPFPAFCLLKNIKTGEEVEYHLEGSAGTTTGKDGEEIEVKEYKSGEKVINLGANCQTTSLSPQVGYPVPKWVVPRNF